ncbi:MAG: hypothetical protein ACRDQU_07775 [Pseudonocardiaceae bacterium]
MTESEATPQDADLDRESSTHEATVDVHPESPGEAESGGEEGADYQQEAEKLAAADYQERMEEFDNVDASVPVTSLPVNASELDKSDLEV